MSKQTTAIREAVEMQACDRQGGGGLSRNEMRSRVGERFDSSRIALESRENESSSVARLGLDSIGSKEVAKRHETSRLPVVTLAGLCSALPVEPAWLWRGYLAAGAVTLLAGRPKVGKSTLLFALLAALTHRQGEFLGLSVQPASVLLLSEEPALTIREKAARFGIAESRTIEVVSRGQVRGLGWERVIAAAADHCQAGSTRLLVVDTLNRWAGLPEDAENKAGAVMAAVEPLLAAADAGLAILALVHQRKSPGTHGEALRGSNALPASVEIVAELERLPGASPVRVLYADSRFQHATPAKLLVELGEDGYVAREAAEVRANEGRATMRAALEASREPLGADALAGATGLRKAVVYELLRGWSEVIVCGGTGRRSSPRLYRLAGTDDADARAAST